MSLFHASHTPRWHFTRLILTFRGDIGSMGVVLASDSRFWTPLSFSKPAFMENQALHITGKIGQHYADGAD
jgi:hypothetical protein